MLRVLSFIIAGVAVCAPFGAVAQQQWSRQGTAPEGWELYATRPASYESGVDKTALYNGYPSAYVKAKLPDTEINSALTQAISAKEYAGKRVRFSGFLKTRDVKVGAGLWMRIDVPSREAARLDNMSDRPVKGTEDWKKFEVVLDVPINATKMLFGAALSGPGIVWLNSCKLEEVGKDVPTTDRPIDEQLKTAPVNLSFEK